MSRLSTGLLIVFVLLLAACTPSEAAPTGTPVSAEDSIYADTSPVTLNRGEVQLSFEYPQPWSIQRSSSGSISLANGEGIIGRDALGELTEGLFTSREVLMNITIARREDFLGDVPPGADAVTVLDSLVTNIETLEVSEVTPQPITIRSWEGAFVAIPVDVFELTALIFPLTDDDYVSIFVLSAPDAYADRWADVLEEIIETFEAN